MTVDELVSLLEAITVDMSVSTIVRQGDTFTDPLDLEDKEFAVLAAFLGGERPTAPERPPAIVRAGRHDDGQPPTEEELEQIEAVERVLGQEERRRRQERQDPDTPLQLKGEFKGVTLP